MPTEIKRQQNIGYILAIIDMFIYGLFPVFANKFSQTMDPLLFGGLALLAGSLPFIFILKKQKDFSKIYSSKYIKPLFLITILTSIGTILFFAGTRLTTGINTGLLIQIEPIYSILISAILLKEVIKKDQILSTIIMVIGAGIIVYEGFAGLNIGNLLILIVPFFYQLSHVVFKKSVDKYKNPNIATTARLFYGGILVTLVAILINPGSLAQLRDLQNLISIFLFGIIFRALDLGLWTQALARLPLAKISAILPLSVAISFTGSVLILRESPTNYQYLGLLFIGSGMLWLTIQHLKVSKKSNS